MILQVRFLKYYASVSFGKDSLAMLLYVLENKLPLDEVVFYDTGMEFRAIYHIRDKVKVLLQEHGVKYTELQPQRSFRYDMLCRPKTKKDGRVVYGDGWCGGPCRWGTFAKQRALAYINGMYVYYIQGHQQMLEYTMTENVHNSLEEYMEANAKSGRSPIINIHNRCFWTVSEKNPNKTKEVLLLEYDRVCREREVAKAKAAMERTQQEAEKAKQRYESLLKG